MDPRDIMSNTDMSLRQVIVVAVTVALCALDGFDVLAISFASPGISSEGGIDRAALGVVLSMELLGMAIGSVVPGNSAISEKAHHQKKPEETKRDANHFDHWR